MHLYIFRWGTLIYRGAWGYEHWAFDGCWRRIHNNGVDTVYFVKKESSFCSQ